MKKVSIVIAGCIFKVSRKRAKELRDIQAGEKEKIRKDWSKNELQE